MDDRLYLAMTGAGIALAAIWNGWQSVQAKREAKAAKENSHPISNGWGAALRSDLAETRHLIGQIHEAQLLAERRELGRDERLGRIESSLDAHLAAHDATA